MTTIHTPTVYDDVIDSRDVIGVIEAIEAEAAAMVQTQATMDLLESLRDLARQGMDASPDWEFGATLVRDDYFVHYAMELADDMGVDVGDLSWPYNCIDWTQAAFELQMDYTPVQFGFITYWVR